MTYHTVQRLIHRTSGKVNSPTFAGTEFSEIRSLLMISSRIHRCLLACRQECVNIGSTYSEHSDSTHNGGAGTRSSAVGYAGERSGSSRNHNGRGSTRSIAIGFALARVWQW